MQQIKGLHKIKHLLGTSDAAIATAIAHMNDTAVQLQKRLGVRYAVGRVGQDNLTICAIETPKAVDYDIATSTEPAETTDSMEAPLVEPQDSDAFDPHEVKIKTRRFFSAFLPGQRIYVDIHPLRPSPAEIITPAWIAGQLRAHNLKLKTFCEDTGISRHKVSEWTTGKRPLTMTTKALFYNYFQAKEAEQIRLTENKFQNWLQHHRSSVKIEEPN